MPKNKGKTKKPKTFLGLMPKKGKKAAREA